MSDLTSISGYCCEVTFAASPEWAATVIRTDQYPTKKEAIIALAEVRFYLAEVIVNHPDSCGVFEISGDEESLANDYDAGSETVIELVDGIAEWILSEFDGD